MVKSIVRLNKFAKSCIDLHKHAQTCSNLNNKEKLAFIEDFKYLLINAISKTCKTCKNLQRKTWKDLQRKTWKDLKRLEKTWKGWIYHQKAISVCMFVFICQKQEFTAVANILWPGLSEDRYSIIVNMV